MPPDLSPYDSSFGDCLCLQQVGPLLGRSSECAMATERGRLLSLPQAHSLWSDMQGCHA